MTIQRHFLTEILHLISVYAHQRVCMHTHTLKDMLETYHNMSQVCLLQPCPTRLRTYVSLSTGAKIKDYRQEPKLKKAH